MHLISYKYKVGPRIKFVKRVLRILGVDFGAAHPPRRFASSLSNFNSEFVNNYKTDFDNF